MFKILIFICFLQSVITCPNHNEISEENLRFRLPRNVRPISYSIALQPDLRPDLDPAPFNASVAITVTPIENTNNITLKIRQLTIDDSSVTLQNSNGDLLEIGNIERDDPNEFYIISVSEELVVGQVYLLTIGSYEGILHLDNGGFYLAKYMEDGIEKRFATTQFQSTNARRAFPSFDEPEWKATFNITLIRPTEFSSISNELLLHSTDLGNGFVVDGYRESVRMSSYLVAFVVSQYEYTERDYQRVFARPQAVRDGWCEYALATGLNTIDALEDFLGIEYALEKMDQIAIPDVHFAPGAMENWGLVTYRESYLLYTEKYSTTQQKQRICTVIAHEFGHQWFGNLVTCQWWKYTWLNEGFATYFEYYAASIVEPSWRLMEQFVFDVHVSLEFDSTNSTTPMNYESSTGGGAPGSITYEKAGSVIRMAEHFLTTSVFRDGLNIYLNNRKFDVGIPLYLFEGFQTAVDLSDTAYLLGGYNVLDILGQWTDQEGHPLVTIVRDYESGSLTLTQERFLIKNYTDQNTNLLWPIPINFMFSARDDFDFTETIADFWFSDREVAFLGVDFPTDGLLIANKQQTGFYRVNYDLENWNRIVEHLRFSDHEDIIPINRAQLIDDVFNLAKTGAGSYTVALDLSRYILKEVDYIPINTFLLEVEFLRGKVAFSDSRELFQVYALNQLDTVTENLSFNDSPDDDHVTRLNRVAVMSKRCDLQDENLRQKSLDVLREWETDDTVLTPDMQQYTFCCALRVGNQDDWDYLYNRYLEEDVEFLRGRILNALGCAEDAEILINYLEKIIDSESPIIDTDRQNAFASVYNSGNTGIEVAFEYLKNNFERIYYSSLNLNTIITGIGSKFNTEDQLNELKQLAEIHGDNYFGATVRTVEENLDWNNKFLPIINTWLQTDNV